jgi:DNA-binding transcriptional ArsR family regulator
LEANGKLVKLPATLTGEATYLKAIAAKKKEKETSASEAILEFVPKAEGAGANISEIRAAMKEIRMGSGTVNRHLDELVKADLIFAEERGKEKRYFAVRAAWASAPCIEFNEQYRGQPFLVDLDAVNLEVVWESRESETIYVQPPIIVKELAERIGISPYLLIHDLANMSIFVRVNQSIKPEVAAFICKKYGFTLILSRHNDPPSAVISVIPILP